MSDFISWCAANQSIALSMSFHVACRSCSNFGRRTKCIEKRNKNSLYKTSKNLSSWFKGKIFISDWPSWPTNQIDWVLLQTGCETKFRQLQTASDVLQKLDKIPNTKTKHHDQEIDPDEILNKFYQKRGFHSKGIFAKNIMLSLTNWN